MTKRVVKLVKKPLTVNNRMKQIRTDTIDSINIVLRKHQEMRDKATSGWSSKNKPRFPKFIKYDKTPYKSMSVGVMVKAPNARQASISVYRMLNDKRHGKMATKVRRVFLAEGYRNKTAVRAFGLFGKGGQLVKRNGKILTSNVNDGIEARLWDETANEILRPMMTTYIKRGYRKGFKTVQGKTINAR